MKILGLILELNPPHNGHKYFIEKAKEIVEPDITIAVISTSFSMRGDVSVIDKYRKTELALKMGVDFVFEFPLALAMQSSDYFAKEAINLLASLGISDLAFGVEDDDLSKLLKIKEIYASRAFENRLKDYLDKGYSYTLSHHNALIDLGESEELVKVASSSNNMLAISYLKALDSYKSINPVLIKRIENNYNDASLNDLHISSATAIRKAIIEQKDISLDVVDPSYDYVDETKAKNNLFNLLKYVYSTTKPEKLTSMFSVNEGIEKRIGSFLDCGNYATFLENVITKRYSINQINRIVLNIVLQRKDSFTLPSYFRLLGFKKSKQKYLSKIKHLGVFSSLKERTDEITEFEEKATKVYDIITGKQIYQLEYKFPIKED